MPQAHHTDNPRHEHQGKSSKGLLDRKEILNALDIAEGQTVLDAGCGDGYMTKEFAKLVKSTGKVYAMDADERAIDNLRNTAGTDIIEPLVGDITTRTNLQESSIDLIYISNVLHGFSGSDMSGFIAETRHLLKPGGILAILEFKKEKTSSGPPLEIRLSPAELKDKIPLTPVKTADIGQYSYIQLFQK
jgi:ubiquinone/menaquinone biosynthesis C-methylase UbiE